VHAGLPLTMQPKLALNSQAPSSFSLPSIEITGVNHYHCKTAPCFNKKKKKKKRKERKKRKKLRISMIRYFKDCIIFLPTKIQ
jgi:hypothetical protein